MGKVIEATTLSLEGITWARNAYLHTADTAVEFSDRIVGLLKKSDYHREHGRKARKFIVKNYSWETSAERLERISEEANFEF